VLKIRLSDGKAEQVADLKNFVYAGHFSDSSLSLTPDDSPLLFRDAGTSDVYAIDWEEPWTAFASAGHPRKHFLTSAEDADSAYPS